MTTTDLGRPIGVSVIAVIAFIQGIIAIVAGLGLIVERNSSTLLEHIDRSSGTLATYGVGSIIWGALALLVGYGLWHGASWARMVVMILQILALLAGIYLLFGWGGHYLWQGVWQIIVSLFVLWLLFNPRAEEFFYRRAG
jgi:hypothetical protein